MTRLRITNNGPEINEINEKMTTLNIPNSNQEINSEHYKKSSLLELLENNILGEKNQKKTEEYNNLILNSNIYEIYNSILNDNDIDQVIKENFLEILIS